MADSNSSFNSAENLNKCDGCFSVLPSAPDLSSVARCPRCLVTRYCSMQCMLNHWKNGPHARVCSVLTKLECQKLEDKDKAAMERTPDLSAEILAAKHPLTDPHPIYGLLKPYDPDAPSYMGHTCIPSFVVKFCAGIPRIGKSIGQKRPRRQLMLAQVRQQQAEAPPSEHLSLQDSSEESDS